MRQVIKHRDIRLLNMFRSNDNDEPLRYASRTLLVIRTMKGLRGRT